MELPMLFIKVIHKNGADVLFFPSIQFLKANSCSESFHGYSFHKNFEHLEEKAFFKSYLININEDFVLGTIQGPFCIFFFKAHTILPRQVTVNSNNSPNLQADELIGLPSITAHCWESWGWTQMPRLSLIPIVPASYPLSTSSIRGSCGVTFQVTTEGNLSQCLEGGGQGSMWSLCTWADVNARNFVEIPGARMVMANLYLGAHLKLCPQPCRGTTHSPADSPRLPSQKERLL